MLRDIPFVGPTAGGRAWDRTISSRFMSDCPGSRSERLPVGVRVTANFNLKSIYSFRHYALRHGRRWRGAHRCAAEIR